jgi:Divergent InlB B-repeat domain/Fibronectin type III domain
MRGRRTSILVALTGTVAASAVLAQGAGGQPRRGADCGGGGEPYITSVGASSATDTSVVLTFSFTSKTGGTYTGDLWSPATPGFSGVFPAGGATISEAIGRLIPLTHYRGTLTIRNDCGSADALIDFRTTAAPPPPACSAAPGIDGLTVGSVAVDSAVVDYTVSSGDAATLHVTVSPGDVEVPGTVAPPGGSGEVPLNGLQPNTAYTVTLTATNGCGESSRQVMFTTLRATDCSGPPSVDLLQVSAIRERSAVVSYRGSSDGAVTLDVHVVGAGVDVVRQATPPGATGNVSLPRLAPGTAYTVEFTMTNECGQASAVRTFTSLARVAVVVVGAGRVTSVPRGISCSRSCARAFASGTSVRLTARPAAGSRFVGWSGACSGTRRVCTFKARDQQVAARFSRAV